MIEFHLDTANAQEGAPAFAVSVIGIGGAGTNVIGKLSAGDLSGTEVISMNCDARALENSTAARKVQLGKNLTLGLGCGGDPELGAEAAGSSSEEIRELLKGRRMVFLCVGLGGGTGSGAAPLVARMARENGAFVVVFATLPFGFEGRRRSRQAGLALNDLKKYANALITFENDRMGELVVPQKGVQEAFEAADTIIGQSIRAVTSLVTQPGLIHIGMDDLVTALRNTDSRCLFGFGQAKGSSRAADALAQALRSPLLDRGQMAAHARNVLVHICGGSSLTLFEIESLMKELGKEVGSDTQILFGAAIDNKLEETLTVTILTSLSKPPSGPDNGGGPGGNEPLPEAPRQTSPAAPTAPAPAQPVVPRMESQVLLETAVGVSAVLSAPAAAPVAVAFVESAPPAVAAAPAAVALAEPPVPAGAPLPVPAAPVVASEERSVPPAAAISAPVMAAVAPPAVEALPAGVISIAVEQPHTAAAVPVALPAASAPVAAVAAAPVLMAVAAPAAAPVEAQPVPPSYAADLFSEARTPEAPLAETRPAAPIPETVPASIPQAAAAAAAPAPAPLAVTPPQVLEIPVESSAPQAAVSELPQALPAEAASPAWDSAEAVPYEEEQVPENAGLEDEMPVAAATHTEAVEPDFEHSEERYHPEPEIAAEADPQDGVASSDAEWNDFPAQDSVPQAQETPGRASARQPAHTPVSSREAAPEESTPVIRIERVPARSQSLARGNSPAQGGNGHSGTNGNGGAQGNGHAGEAPPRRFVLTDIINREPAPSPPGRNASPGQNGGHSRAVAPAARQFQPDMDRITPIRPILIGRSAAAAAPAPAPVVLAPVHTSPQPVRSAPTPAQAAYTPARSAPAPSLAPVASAVPQAASRHSPTQQQTFDERLQPPSNGERFKGAKPTVEDDEDLDVPTFLRRKR